ncbi:hypothetical protein [Nocardia niigatensis]|uniref:hypothetical protein n=1 Tax=Nocardia niigatensis TaxID=209249 RepID=UPI0002EC6DFB|nr:hypothetical protein [Nocardia niigatensis]
MSETESALGGPDSTELARESRSLMATPKSAVWQWLLGAPALVGIGVATLIANVMTDAFKENPAVRWTESAIGWVVLAYFLAESARRGYRLVRDRAGLTDPRPVELPEPGAPWGPETEPEEKQELTGNWAAAVLGELPIHTYETGLLLDVLGASAAARLPATTAETETPSAPKLLASLTTAGAVKPVSPGRYRLTAVPDDTAAITETPEWRAALAVLLRSHAEEATLWARALDLPAYASTARRWFENEEPRLCRLLRDCAKRAEPEPGQAHDALLIQVRGVVPDLAAIADALDIWFARSGRAEDSAGTGGDPDDPGPAAAMVTITAATRYGPLHALADIRARVPERRPARYSPWTVSRSLRARALHRQALGAMDTTDANLDKAVNLLEQAWWLLPREDVAGEVCALVNMAIGHLMQGRHTAARDRLELAESMAAGGRDPSGLAHVHEVTGVLDWSVGEPRRALSRWQTALNEWRALADELGTGRCLQHLGSAAVIDPSPAAYLVDSDVVASPAEVVRQAIGWLVEAHQLDSTLTYAETHRDDLLTQLNELTGPASLLDSLPGLDRWPLPPPDQATGSG